MSKKNTKKQNSGKNVLAWVAGILAALIIVGLAVFNMADNWLNVEGNALRMKTAAKTENYSLSGTEMAYFGINAYQQFSVYASYLNIDLKQSLKTQEISEGVSWFDYIMNNAKSSVTSMLALAEYAHDNGIELEDEDLVSINKELSELNEVAKKTGYSEKAYLRNYYKYLGVKDNGINTKDYENALRFSAIANKAAAAFYASIDMTAEEKQEYYENHKEDFDGIDYYVYVVNVASSSDEESEDEKSAEAALAAIDFANSLKDAKNGEEFKQLVRSYETSIATTIDESAIAAKAENTFRSHALRSSIGNEDVRNFLFSAKPGESESFLGETGYTVVLLEKEAYRDDITDRAVRHILIKIDSEAENGDEEAKAMAEDILAQLKEADFSEEKWNELAKEYSVDTGSNEKGGLYEALVHDTTYAEFNAWLFDEDRQVGDSDVVKTEEGGYHVMYYVGEAETQAWMTTAESQFIDEQYDAMIEKYSESLEFFDNVIEKIELN